MAPKMLIIDYSKCQACGICENACATREEDAPRGFPTRIRTVIWDLEGWGVPIACQHCTDAPCQAVCPRQAISRDEELARVMIEYERCIGCRMCLAVCPFGAIGYDSVARRVIKCDLCDGDPLCASLCSYGAIQYVETMDRVPEVARKIRNLIMGDRFAGEGSPAVGKPKAGGLLSL